jgi:hypothetical protein
LLRRPLVTLTAGTFTAIPALQFARLVELQEDDSVPSVGLMLKFPEDAYTAAFTYKQEAQPVILGQRVGQFNNKGTFVGEPVQTGLNARAADIYVMASCLTGTTALRVTEED